MLRCAASLFCLLLLASGFHQKIMAQSTTPAAPPEWQTHAEKTNYRETPRYDETIAFARKLDDASPLIRYTSFGRSGEGRALPLVIAATGNDFTPQAARRAGKAVVLDSSLHTRGRVRRQRRGLRAAARHRRHEDSDGAAGPRRPPLHPDLQHGRPRAFRPLQPHQPGRPRGDGLARDLREPQSQPRLHEGGRAGDARVAQALDRVEPGPARLTATSRTAPIFVTTSPTSTSTNSTRPQPCWPGCARLSTAEFSRRPKVREIYWHST